jgi:hypothetical protein
MNDEYRNYMMESKILEDAMESVDNKLQKVVERFKNNGALSYPNESINFELNASYKRLIRRSEEILEKLRSVHRSFNSNACPSATVIPDNHLGDF